MTKKILIIFFALFYFWPHIVFSAIAEKSWLDFQYDEVEKQVQFLSCGAAALATLIKKVTGVEIGEEVIYNEIGIEDEMLSLYDLVKFIDRHPEFKLSYKASIVTISSLYEHYIPSLVNINVEGFPHFVVLTYYCKKTDTVHLADSVQGNIEMPNNDFEEYFYSTNFKRNIRNGKTGAILYIYGQK